MPEYEITFSYSPLFIKTHVFIIFISCSFLFTVNADLEQVDLSCANTSKNIKKNDIVLISRVKGAHSNICMK